MVYDGILLESVEGLGDPMSVVNSGQIWQRLQDEKTDVSQRLLDLSRLDIQINAESQAEASEQVTRDIEWCHRAQLESRLRDISEAQDRLIEGGYGLCIDCGNRIDQRRLDTDVAAARCLSCQATIDARYRTTDLLPEG